MEKMVKALEGMVKVERTYMSKFQSVQLLKMQNLEKQ